MAGVVATQRCTMPPPSSELLALASILQARKAHRPGGDVFKAVVQWPLGASCADGLPGIALRHTCPGWHFIALPESHAELHVHVGEIGRSQRDLHGHVDWCWPSGAFVQHTPQATRRAKRVAVVGAGLAGSAVAHALCSHGTEVHLYDAASGPAQGASGNWAGAFHPHITRGDSPLSQLTRLGFEYTLHALQSLTEQGLLKQGEDWDTPGHFQSLPQDEAARMQETLGLLNFPTSLVSWVAPGQWPGTPLGGLYFPQGGWVRPARWVEANLQACGQLLHVHYNARLNHLNALAEEFDAVVVAAAEHTLALAPMAGAQLGMVKGQISLHRAVQPLPAVLSGETYAIGPQGADWLVLGATYERPVGNMEPTHAADAHNFACFKTAFPELPLGPLQDHRCAVRAVWHDRLPAIGPLPEADQTHACPVYLSTGFASRGLLWAAMAGQVLAGYCTGQPLLHALLRRVLPRAAKVGRASLPAD
ncbi:MAG TPA: FAD-dependent 5-carboxymethylaminomethyl-2-thiouridine(34) oxidoreductase MnmC [Limnobacter sp.]|nr:FAD-dependent 5-carboxymethylaminomethyl-2-thiouridine(34) oxidoreductase MnmC [Limnobacter sp.]